MKKAFSLILTFCLLLSALPMGALAAEENQELKIQHSYSQNGFTFEKISHATSGPETPDGIVDYLGNGHLETFVPGVSEDGKGDTVQSYCYCGAAYGDWMYVGTMYGALGAYNTITSNLGDGTLPDGAPAAIIDAMFNGKLNKGVEDDGAAMGGIFFKFNVKTGETKLLMSRELYKNGECNGVPILRSACEYNGKLYFVGIISNGEALAPLFAGMPNAQDFALDLEIKIQCGVPCIYELDPETDTLVEVYRCVNSADYLALSNYKPYDQTAVFTSTRAIGTYKDYLIAGGIQKGPVVHEGYAPGDAVLLATNDPSQENFKVIAHMSDLFNYPAIWRDGSSGGGGIYQVIEFNDKLYVAICSGDKTTQNPENGVFRPFAIVRGEYDETKGAVDEAAAWTWTPLVGDQEKDGATYTFGIDPARCASSACTMEIYGDHLYIGEYNDVNGSLMGILARKSFATLATNLEQSINLYRMDADENMELVIGDATEMFPNGSTSGYGSGFASHMSQYTWMTNVYKDVMYLSYMDESSLLRCIAAIASGEWMDMSKEEMQSQLNYIKVLIDLMRPVEDGEETFPKGGTTTQALAAVRQAVADMNQKTAEHFALSMDQMRELCDGLKSGEIAANTLHCETVDELYQMNCILEALSNKLGESLSPEFVDMYEKAVATYDKLATTLPAAVKELYGFLTNEDNQKLMADFMTCYKYMTKSEAGFDLIAITEDADQNVKITPVTTNGFGDRYNHGLRIFVNTDDYMGVGTANPFLGTQIWRMSATPFDVIKSNLPFDDVLPSDWYYNAVEYVYENGMMAGISPNLFAPEAELTRAMLVQILYAKEGYPATDNEVTFRDVNDGDWYADAVRWAAENEMVAGYNKLEFGANDPVTREQMVAILYRYALAKGAAAGDDTGDNMEMGFSDAKDISLFAVKALKWAVDKGLITGMGDNLLCPQATTTRAQTAQVLMQMAKANIG